MPPIRNRVELDQHKMRKQQAIFEKEDIKKNSEKVKKQKQADGAKADQARLQRDTTPMFNYYKNWDKYADDALKELDKESDDDVDGGDGFIPAKKPTFEDEGPLSQAQMLQRTSGARPNTKVVIKGGTIKKNTLADQLKAEGNAFFASLDFDRAIEKYTRCIPEVPASDHTLRTVVYSNRA